MDIMISYSVMEFTKICYVIHVTSPQNYNMLPVPTAQAKTILTEMTEPQSWGRSWRGVSVASPGWT